MPFVRHQTVLKFVAAVILGALTANAQTLPQGVRKGASIAGVTEYTYPNGLRVLLLPDSGSGTITVNATYLVGSRHEGYGETGMAHLLEHMNFITSTHGRNIKKELVDHGARWNGTTSFDRTNYFETVNASDDNLTWALGLEAERMVNMRIEKELLDTEMTVVRNEFERGENSPARILEERVYSTAYLWHNYGKSTIGSRADIERVPIERLAAFYRKYYQPDNAVLIVAGQIDSSKALAMIANTMGAIPRPDRKLDATYTVEPAQDGERSIELRRVGKGKDIVMAYHTPALAHPDTAALDVLTDILAARGGTGRLEKALVDSKKALTARMSVEELHDPGIAQIAATLSDEQSLDDVKKTILDTLATLADEGATEAEVNRAKTRIVQGTDRMMANSQQLGMRLSEFAAAGDWRLLFTNYQEVKGVTAADIKRVAKIYFKNSNLTVGMFIPDPAPDRTTVPDAPEIDELLTSYKPEINVEAGEFIDPAPAAIEKRIRRSTVAGMRLVLLPKETRGNRVQASLTIRFGDEATLVGKNAAAQLTEALLMRGTKNKSRQQIQDRMQELNATINIGGFGFGGRGGGSLSSVTAVISATAENLVPTVELAMEILREPALSESDFDQVRRQEIAQIDRGRTDPGVLVQLALQANLNPFPKTDVRHVRTIDEQIEDLKNVTLNDVKTFHQVFYGASQGELIVVGKFDAASLEKAAAGLLGSWKSSKPYERIVNNYKSVQSINSKIETPDKENAQFSAGLTLSMRDTDPDYPAMVMANYMFGGGITSRLPDRVRNREGLSYGVGSGFNAPPEGNAASFTVFAIANPRNTPKVEASFMDELARTLRDGFTAAELTAAKKAIHDERTVGRSSDAGILNLISSREQYSRTLTWDEQLDSKLEALTLEQVNTAFRRHINTTDLLIVKGGDFKAANVYQ
jgi:zinc protease